MNLTRPLTATAVALMALMVTTPVTAQEGGGRFLVMIPNLQPQEGARDNFGKDTAKELRELLEDFDTHQPVDKDDIEDAAKKYDLDHEKLTCIQARQLAMQLGWQLVMCGDYTQPDRNMPASVTAQFVGSDGTTFDIPQFSSSRPEEAAQQIATAFEQFTAQLRLASFCADYLESNQFENALNTCNQALDINPSSPSALYNKGYALMQMERLEESLDVYAELLENNPIHQDALKSAGIVATQLNRRDEAHEYFNRYLELDPGNVDVRLTIATDIANAGDPRGALRIAREGLDGNEDHATLNLYIGHFAMNAAQEAETMPTGANGEAPGPQQAGEETLNSEARELYEVAGEAYQQAFETQGDSVDAVVLANLVRVYTKLDQPQEAVRIGRRATAAKPDETSIWMAHAQALDRAGEVDEALAAYDRAESLDPDLNVGPRKANLLLKTGQAERAAQLLTRAVEEGQIDRQTAFGMLFGFVYRQKFQQGQHSEALRLFDEIVDPFAEGDNQLAVNFWKGYILFQRGQQMQEPSTLQSARESLPVFQRALRLFQAARGYERVQPSANVPRFIENTQQFIEIQEALIKRGR